MRRLKKDRDYKKIVVKDLLKVCPDDRTTLLSFVYGSSYSYRLVVKIDPSAASKLQPQQISLKV